MPESAAQEAEALKESKPWTNPNSFSKAGADSQIIQAGTKSTEAQKTVLVRGASFANQTAPGGGWRLNTFSRPVVETSVSILAIRSQPKTCLLSAKKTTGSCSK